MSFHTQKFTTATYEPMQRINIDTINMDKPDDCFSWWVELYAVPDLTAISAATALLHFVGRYGTPDQIQCDQGTQYVNELIKAFTVLIGSTLKENITPYSKEEN